MKRIDELVGSELDYWVARAVGMSASIERKWPNPMAAVVGEPPMLCWVTGWKIAGPVPFKPSSDWADGGPMIEQAKAAVWRGSSDQCWSAGFDLCAGDGPGIYMDHWHDGPTPLVAAMRALVARKFGSFVSNGDSASQ